MDQRRQAEGDRAAAVAEVVAGGPHDHAQAHAAGELGAEVVADRLAPGDVLLLCSDGVWEPLHAEEIAAELERPCPDEAARALVAAAYAAGSSDNLTAVVVRVEGEPAAP